ncbi:MAG: hypothetical protein LQ351_000851 [Letrouitia transgressa]|nr:MAG: hypothetical protein LQ351_000851 [Letrouitia transgressa]
MLPTPSTSHVNFNRIYEPAEDSYLILDTLASETEATFLNQRFGHTNSHDGFSASPLVLEVGTGSGVVLAFVTAHAQNILGRPDVLSLGIDVNPFACFATEETVQEACRYNPASDKRPVQQLGSGTLLASINGDLEAPIRPGSVDILIFNPPYVPTPGPLPCSSISPDDGRLICLDEDTEFEAESRLLALSYSGGKDGMEITSRLLQRIPWVLDPTRGVAYVLLCQQNRPAEVVGSIKQWGYGWTADIVGKSGKVGGWEKLQIIKIYRKP